jgi:hypothetical protein
VGCLFADFIGAAIMRSASGQNNGNQQNYG